MTGTDVIGKTKKNKKNGFSFLWWSAVDWWRQFLYVLHLLSCVRFRLRLVLPPLVLAQASTILAGLYSPPPF